MIGNGQTEGFQAAGYGTADPAEAVNSDAAAAKRQPGQGIHSIAGPTPGAQPGLGPRQLAQGVDEQADRRIGHLLRQDIRGIGHHDVAAGGFLCGDHVVTDAEQGNDLEPWQPVDQGRVEPGKRCNAAYGGANRRIHQSGIRSVDHDDAEQLLETSQGMVLRPG